MRFCRWWRKKERVDPRINSVVISWLFDGVCCLLCASMFGCFCVALRGREAGASREATRLESERWRAGWLDLLPPRCDTCHMHSEYPFHYSNNSGATVLRDIWCVPRLKWHHRIQIIENSQKKLEIWRWWKNVMRRCEAHFVCIFCSSHVKRARYDVLSIDIEEEVERIAVTNPSSSSSWDNTEIIIIIISNERNESSLQHLIVAIMDCCGGVCGGGKCQWELPRPFRQQPQHFLECQESWLQRDSNHNTNNEEEEHGNGHWWRRRRRQGDLPRSTTTTTISTTHPFWINMIPYWKAVKATLHSLHTTLPQ